MCPIYCPFHSWHWVYLLVVAHVKHLMTVKVSSCIDGKCNDDPEVGTHINGGSSITPPPPPPGTCQPSGTLACNGGKPKNTYTCSPPVTSSTPAVLTNNNFEKGGDGGGPSACDNKYHDNSERIVALSTGWYNGGSQCGKMIRITTQNGRSVSQWWMSVTPNLYD